MSPLQLYRASWSGHESLDDIHKQWVEKHGKSSEYRFNSMFGGDLVFNFDVNPPRLNPQKTLGLDQGIPTPNIYFFETIKYKQGHAILAIFFPKDDVLDILTTYPLPPEQIDAFKKVFEDRLRRTIVARDISSILSTGEPEINLQLGDEDSCGPDGGWCLAWTMILADWLIDHRDIWYDTPEERLKLYGKMYLEMLQSRLRSKTAVRDAWNKIRTGSSRRKTRRSLAATAAKHRLHHRSRRVKH